MAIKQLKVLKNIGIHKAEENVFITVDKANIPLERFWRNRFQDGDVEWVKGNRKVSLNNNDNKEEKS
jgi:hypothetical protein